MKFSSLLFSLSVLASFSATAYAGCQTVPADVPEHYIVISRQESALYFGLGGGQALHCPVAIPADSPAKKWMGWNYVEDKFEWPAWQAPKMVQKAHPEFGGDRIIPSGDPHNPMGAAAMVLHYHESAIHGTTQKMRASIGTAASFGCIRMYNEDVTTLYQYVNKGDNVCMGTNVADALRRCQSALNNQSTRYMADRNFLR